MFTCIRRLDKDVSSLHTRFILNEISFKFWIDICENNWLANSAACIEKSKEQEWTNFHEKKKNVKAVATSYQVYFKSCI